MSQIESNAAEAQAYATALNNAAQSLANVAAGDKDGMTTVAGNGNAHSLMDLAASSASNVADILTSAVANINSVAAEFQAVDQNIAAEIAEGD